MHRILVRNLLISFAMALLCGETTLAQSVKLTWTSTCTNCTYNVVRNKAVIGASITPTTEPNGQYSWIDIGPASGQDTYTVRSVSPDSNAVTVTVVPNTPPPPPANSATWVGQSSSKGTYGADGQIIALQITNLPSYATVLPKGVSTWTWASGITCWYSPAPFTINLNVSGSHQIALYAVDFDGQGRSETFTITDSSGKILDTRSISNFNSGVYLAWNISGNVNITINGSYPNGVLSSVLFGN